MTDSRCGYVSPRGGIRCELSAGHGGSHRAWDERGIPTLVMNAKEVAPDGR